MNCFNHRDVPAIGLCKSCGKALYDACMTELTNGLACKGACESRVNMINRMLDANSQVMSATRHQLKSSGILSLIIGIGFLVFAVWSFQEMDSFLPYFLSLMGVVILVTGFLRLSRRQEYPSPESKKE